MQKAINKCENIKKGNCIPLRTGMLSIVLIFFATLNSSCSDMKYKEKKYDWRAGFSAAANFPSKLYTGYLYSEKHGEVLRGSGVDGTPYVEWGMGGSSVGKDNIPLPTKLHLIWFCFVEDQFYEAHIDLDIEKIRAIFDKGYPDQNPPYGFRIRHDFEFLVNVAPGGTVAVWLWEGAGKNKTEVGFYPRVAKKIDVPWKKMVPLGSPREIHVPNTVARNVDSSHLASYREQGIPYDRWANYRKKYQYNLLFREGDRPLYIYWHMVNGEKKNLENKFVGVRYQGEYHELALPRMIHFVWHEPEPDENLYTVEAKILEREHDKMRSFFYRHEGKASFYIEPQSLVLKLFLLSGDEKMEIELEEHEIFRLVKN